MVIVGEDKVKASVALKNFNKEEDGKCKAGIPGSWVYFHLLGEHFHGNK